MVPVLYPSQAPYAAVAGAWEVRRLGLIRVLFDGLRTQSLEFTIARGVFPLLVVGALGVVLSRGAV